MATKRLSANIQIGASVTGGFRSAFATARSSLVELGKETRSLAGQQRLLARARDQNLASRAQIRGQMMDTVALGMMAAAPIKMAIDFENAMLGVAKQLDGARDASG